MRDRKGYLKNSKQGKKGCVKMALDNLRKQKRDEDRSRGDKTSESEEYSSGAKYESSVQFWASLSRLKTTTSDTSDIERCGRSMPFLEDSKCEHKDVRETEDSSITKNIGKMFKCSNKENKKIHADTTSQMVSKEPGHAVRHKMKFKQIVKEKRKYLSSKYKIEKRNHESTNKELNTSINTSEKSPASNKTNKIQIPVQIDREKLKITSEERLSEKEVNNSKSSYYRSETMEADSTVSSDNNKNINQRNDVSQHKFCESVTSDKFRRSSNIPTVSNQNYLSIKERKRKRIKEKFRNYFDKCLTTSEEEEEEAIIDLSICKRRRNDFNETLNDSTNIESHSVLEVQDVTTNLVSCENITNNIVSKETSKIKNVKQVEAVSSIMDVIECINDKTVCDNDVFVLENECPVDKNSNMEEVAMSALPNNDEEIQTNLSNELQIKILNYSSENRLLNSDNNAKGNYVEKSSTFHKPIDLERDELPDSNINNDNCNDTSMKVLQNSYTEELQLTTDSGALGTVAKISNSTLDSSTLVKEILETSKNTENQSTTLQDNVSIDTTTQKESAVVANINFTESHAKNINNHSVDIQLEMRPCTETSKCTVRNSHMSLQNITDSTLKVHKDCTKSVHEDLNQLLQMDINQNHRIQSDGNTIRIQENLEKATSQNVTAKEIYISNVTNKENEISSKHTASKTEVKLIEKRSTTITDIGLKENINTHNVQNKDDALIPILSGEEAKLSTNNNTVGNASPIVSETSKQQTLPDCNAKDTDNFNQPETIPSIKIRVLSSAELGSRWCPTPANNLASSSVTEPNLSSHTTTEPVKDNEPCKDSTTDPRLNFDSISPDTKLSLSYIYNIIMRIRTIHKKYLSTNCQNMTDKQKTISGDKQFKSNFTVLLQEFLNLQTELKIYDIDTVVRYAIFMINEHLIPPQCEPIFGKELSRYMKALNVKSLKLKAASPSTNFSVPSEQGISLDNAHIATTKPVSSVLNNSNVVPVTTISFIPNAYVSTVSQGHIVYNNSPRQNIYVSNVSNQNHEYNISNLQAAQTPSTTVSYVPLMQSTNMPYHQRITQQQPIPVNRMNNVSNANIQLQSNIHNAPKLNIHQKQQESIIRNKSEFLIGQSTVPQRLPQQPMSHNIPQVSPKAQIYMQQNAKNAQASCSTTLPMHSQIYMPQNAKNMQVSCSTTLPTHSQIYMPQNAKNTQASCSTTLPMHSQIYMPQNAKNTQASCSTTFPMRSSNLLPIANTILDELAFKIWDQLTYCFELKIIDCRLLHNAYSKNCLLQTFHDKWKQAMNNFIYQRMQSNKLTHPQSLEGKRMFYILYEKWRREQIVLKNTELQNQSVLMDILKNKNIKQRQNMVSPLKAKSPNLTVQSEVTQHISRKTTKNVELEEQQQSQVALDLQLLNNMILSKNNVAPNAAEKYNAVLVRSDFINSDNITVLSHKTNYVENVNVAAFTSLEGTDGKQKNMTKTDGVSSLERNNIEVLEVTDVQKESLLLEQTRQEVVHTREESSLPEQTITEEVVHVQEKNSLPEQTIKEVVDMEKESSLPEQTITEEVIHVQDKNSLPEQTIKGVVHMEKESSLPEQTITEEVVHVQEKNSLPEQIITKEVVHVQEKNSLPEQTIKEVLHMEKDSSLSEQTITEEVVHVEEKNSLAEQIITQEVHLQEKNSLPEQTIKEVIHMEKESSLPEQTITEEVVHMQEKNSLLEQIITKEVVHVQEKNSFPEQTIKEVVHMEKESLLPEQTITEEVIHVQEKISFPEQTIKEVVHMEKESLLPEQTITEEVIHVQEKNSLPEQIIREDVHMEIESSLPEQTIGEEVTHGKEHSSLIEQIIKDNTNYLQCDSIQSVTVSDPHIVDVRSISPTSFNRMDNTSIQNNFEVSSNEDTENTEVKVKIEIPDDKIICLQCSEESTVVCEVCIKAHYCSKECQVLHWSLEHHKDCKPHSLRLSEEDDNDAPITEDTDFDFNYMNVP